MAQFWQVGALALAFVSPPAVEGPAVYTKNPSVKQLICGNAAGTAFHVGPNVLVSAEHVTSRGPCTIDGRPVGVVHKGPFQDVVFVYDFARSPTWLRIRCGGYRDGAWYRSIGYARGLPRQRQLMQEGTTYADNGSWPVRPFAVLWGDRFIKGMSGGPVLNGAGEVVGVINARSDKASYSRPLRETELCR